MKRSVDRRMLLLCCIPLVALALAFGVGASSGTPSVESVASVVASETLQGSTAEFNPPIECWFHNQFPQLDAAVQPESGIRTVRLYYRCSSFADFYFVDMKARSGGGYRAVAPMAEESCPSVLYYVEAVEESFNSTRSEEREADVTSETECRRRDPAAAFFTGDDPGIVVGATREGAAAIPPGFKAVGITGFFGPAAAAAAAGSGGGATGPIVLGVVAAAGGGAAIAVAAGGGSSTTTSAGGGAPPTAPTTTTSPATTSVATTTVGSAPTACFTTDPSPPQIKAGDAIRLDARCSTLQAAALTYHWDLGDGRVREDALITPIYRDPGRFTVTLTVSEGGVSSSRSIDVTVEAVITTTIYFQPLSRTTIAYRSYLGVNGFDGTAVGIILANGTQTANVTNAAPGAFRIDGPVGKNTIRGYLAAGGAPEGFWRFDFTGEPNFVSGSISVRRGRVLALESRAVVFRLEPGERAFVEFDFSAVP